MQVFAPPAPVFARCLRSSAPRWHASAHPLVFAQRPECVGQRRRLQTTATPSRIPDFAFAFDIDGVLLRSADPIPGASKALTYLQSQHIPFILLTNGGGKSESERVAELSEKLSLPLSTSNFMQSHTPFAGMEQYKDKTVLVCGGDGAKCRDVAEQYGYKTVVTPGDIYAAYPEIWPFSKNFLDYYRSFARPLPRPIDAANPNASLKIDAVFVYNDPRDWGLDAAIILDVLLSQQGVMGTVSPKNGDRSLPNRGYLQDGQPPLYYSNPDLWWAAKYHLSRLGQGGFREALEGIWAAVTGGERQGVELKKAVFGKPFRPTYEYAENLLNRYRGEMFAGAKLEPLKRVYMVGDNPESDIRGANMYDSPLGTDWKSVLVQTGVYQKGSEPAWKPRTIVKDVYEAVRYAVEDSKWERS
ncbi:had superfamily [Diplodia corticola]|uniref:Had superfamily n=1 Tax=Diplodia corticola TaxID=236234 RepID=A0A1J9R043_9PEZI|nr:had superfamily [Diplodia corticola]OJD33977.1 had superfamily [Diplodia corticola]